MSVVPRDTKFHVLLAVKEHWSRNRFGPTVQELTDAVEVKSRSTVQFHINDLVADGYLTQVRGKRRTLRVSKKGDKLIQILGDE